MLYHVIAEHGPQDCPMIEGQQAARYANTVGKVRTSEWASQNGVTVHAMVVDGPAHKIFMTLEADKPSQLKDFLRPIKHVGPANVSVVADLRG